MGLVDRKSGKEIRYTVEQLEEEARTMRALDIASIYAAGSGHSGGTLSIMDITAALFLNEARIDPSDPDWEDRDRIIYSAGHKAPALYAGLARAGFYDDADVMTLRKLDSPFQGHPHAPWLKGVEVSTGSLGQGFGVSVGCALAARLDGKAYRTYCIMGDGEQQEGSVWEAAMSAAHYKLDNLCAIVDRNRLQIDGDVREVMDIDPVAAKYKSFNWHVIEIDGHDMGQILSAFARARAEKGRPSVIIANTVKGKGVSYMENVAGWHGIAPGDDEQFRKAIDDIACPSLSSEHTGELLKKAGKYQEAKQAELMKELPSFGNGYWWNRQQDMRVEMEPTRTGFGRSLASIGDDRRIVTIHADISSSIKIADFEKGHPERMDRVFSVGIAEQNMMAVAAGLAREGKIPVTGTYGVFASGRCWDQIRTTICYDNLNVKIAGAHGGISVGADGATHQALEEIALMSILPNMHLFIPCDSLETERLSTTAITKIVGPAYVRFGREAVPVVTSAETPLEYGKANVIRYRGRAPRFADAFETCIAEKYQNESEELTLVACGAMVAEAMRAACILKEEKGVEARVINMHTIKPLDGAALAAATRETGVIVTCEEHQTGGFGNIVAGAIAASKLFDQPFLLDMVGVADRFGESGGPWELMIRFGLSAEFIAERSLKLLEKRPTVDESAIALDSAPPARD
jgi:transketolase